MNPRHAFRDFAAATTVAEHKVLERSVGTWDATVTAHGAPAGKGVEVK